MKGFFILALSLNFCILSNAQNTFPLPSGWTGIGTNSPAGMLEIAHNGAGQYGTALQIKTTAGSDGPRLSFEAFNDGNPKRWNIGMRFQGTSFGLFEDGYIGSFGTERFTILPGGNMGIGTGNPQNTLQVNGTANFTGTTTLGTNSIGGPGSYGLFFAERGTSYTEVAVHNQGAGAMLYANPQGVQYSGMWGTEFPGYSTGLIANPYTPLVFGVGYESMRISLDGKLCIGGVNPDAKLTITGTSLSSLGSQSNISAFSENGIRINASNGVNSQDGIMYKSGSNGGGAGIAFGRGGSWDTYMSFYTNPNTNGGTGNIIERMRLDNNGNLGIGTTNPGIYKLAVRGAAIFTKVQVKADNGGTWPDYVFHPNYELRSLSSLEAYINEYNHLPDVPSANEVEKDGLDLGATQAVLLKKIEELTLYVIEQGKKIEKLQSEVKRIKK